VASGYRRLVTDHCLLSSNIDSASGECYIPTLICRLAKVHVSIRMQLIQDFWRKDCRGVKSESGGIGRRAGLRIQSRKGWGFNSPLSHHIQCNNF
jgi:hypothetical protein